MRGNVSDRSISAAPRKRAGGAGGRRSGKIVVMLLILLPTLFGIAGLVLDGGLMMSDFRNLQHAADAASTAAAMQLNLGKSNAAAITTANEVVHVDNDLPGVSVNVAIPPGSGKYAGQSGHVEVTLQSTYRSRFMRILDGVFDRTLRARSVSSVEDVTEPAAIVVLDRDPTGLTVNDVDDHVRAIDPNDVATAGTPQTGTAQSLSSVPVVGATVAGLVDSALAAALPAIVSDALDDAAASLPIGPAPSLLAGMEVEGIGRLIVDGAVHVNTEWGGMDENGDLAGSAAGPPYALTCMPILPLTRMRARDIRVVGGVDNRTNYEAFTAGGHFPLQANRLPVADPFAGLPAPSASSDGTNINATVQSPSHSVRIALSPVQANALVANVNAALPAFLRPLFAPLTSELTTRLTTPTLTPGVYDSITVLSPLGGATFLPGIYIIRNKSPLTNMALCVIGPVEAEGVMFYLTDSAGFDGISGQPDSADGPDATPYNLLTSLPPSAVILPLLAGGRFSGLNDPGSPFHHMLIYQRRIDRRPIIIDAQKLLGGGDLSGTIYTKYGHTILVGGGGTHDLRLVTGTLRVVTITDTTIAPSVPLPPAQDVLLVE